ncbi:MAG: hypothetical protein LBQ38_00905 [Spirochaetaceae bacterium]|jgi:hypothetical protein|nr:hypothetical protein [Spirochaetaceae bacterium]
MRDLEKVIGEAKAALLPFESWERLPGETGAAYAAFCSYRDYGPDRNVRRAVEGHFRKTESPPVPDILITRKYRMWRNWSTQFRWRERAADYDQYLDRLKQTEKRKTIEAQEAVYREATGKMLQVVNKKLDLLVMEPGELTQGAVVEWLTTAISTDRELAGITTAPKGDRENSGGKQLEIQFTPEFEGL